MRSEFVFTSLVLVLGAASGLRGQQKPEPGVQEFPVVLEQNVTAGKTAVGTTIQAKLTIATLVNGTVVPKNATFSGKIVESTAKSGTQPSRLSILMDSVTWKTGSAPVKVYISAWYYPTLTEAGQNLHYGPDQPTSRTWNGAGAYPDPNSPAYKPFPGGDSDNKGSVPDTPSSTTARHRTLMKDVQSERGADGTIRLVSKHNLKFDKVTTYVLAAGDLVPVK